jgi:hypothetical protein
MTFPFLTSYDPPGTSEGTLDPLGLYQIGDQLAVQLVPAVRERMQRIRFLTAMAVGAMVTEGLECDARHRHVSPYLVWEWLIVESLIRAITDDSSVWGVPGTLVTRRAFDEYGYLDARSYLKTPRIFGFHGVYKRLAQHLGLVDVHLGPGPNTEPLVDTWARGVGFHGLEDARPMLSRWREAVRRSLRETPPRTKTNWRNEEWSELANAFHPAGCRAREKRYLRALLHSVDERRLGALPVLWQLQDEFDNDGFCEEMLHDQLEKRAPEYAPLLTAIRAYEAFARSLQDGFDVLKAEAARLDAHGYAVPEIARDAEFRQSVTGLHERFDAAHQALGAVPPVVGVSAQSRFIHRFQRFGEPMDAAMCALALCEHHKSVQQAKSADGKRPWFDFISHDRIFVRHAYREPRREIQPGRYAHAYRGWPIRRFYRDLS